MPAAYLLEDFAHSSAVPVRLQLLRLALECSAPVAPTLFIPPNELFGTFLAQKKVVELLHERSEAQSDPGKIELVEAKILHLFAEQELDAALAQEVTHAYHHKLQSGFVRVFGANAPAQNQNETENILGDSNVLESLQQLSCKILEESLVITRATDTQLLAQVSGICIQTQLQASCSGTVSTRHQEQPEKKVFAVFAWIGVQNLKQPELAHDLYEVHKSSLQEIEATIGKKPKYWKRIADNVELMRTTKKQESERILSKKQVLMLAKFAEKIGRKVFRPLSISWELQKNELYITECKELPENYKQKDTSSSPVTLVVATSDTTWTTLDTAWKSHPEATAKLVHDLTNTKHLVPNTAICIPKVTNLHELEQLRLSLLEGKHCQSWKYWPEISSIGALLLLKQYSALDFFAGFFFDIPKLMRSLFVVPTWTQEEYDLLFSLIDRYAPTRVARGLLLEEIPQGLASHALAAAYSSIRVPQQLVQSVQAGLSVLEEQRWNALP